MAMIAIGAGRPLAASEESARTSNASLPASHPSRTLSTRSSTSRRSPSGLMTTFARFSSCAVKDIPSRKLRLPLAWTVTRWPARWGRSRKSMRDRGPTRDWVEVLSDDAYSRRVSLEPFEATKEACTHLHSGFFLKKLSHVFPFCKIRYMVGDELAGWNVPNVRASPLAGRGRRRR